MLFRSFVVGVLVFAMQASGATQTSDPANPQLRELQHRWARANYELQGDTQVKAFEALIKDAQAAVIASPRSAELWTWDGIIQSTFAGVKGGLGALSYAKGARDALQKAIAIKPDVLQGSALSSLGTLYFRVPGWPVGFGDDEKAAKLLKQGVEVNPDGIDSNFFYAEFLRDQGDYKKAEHYLLKASSAAPRPHRPLADAGRRKEIEQALAAVRKELAAAGASFF